MWIQVTEQHIGINPKGSNQERCMIAVAIRQATRLETFVSHRYAIVGGAEYLLPKTVSEAISAWSQNRHLKPFTFWLPIPKAAVAA